MTKQEIFEDAEGFYFAAGHQLPKADGDLSSFHVEKITLERKVSVGMILKKYLHRLGFNAPRGMEARSRALLEACENKILTTSKNLILHIDNAEYLTTRMLEGMRLIRENLHRRNENLEKTLCIVLTGDIEDLLKKIEASGSLKYRTKKLPTVWPAN